MRDFLDACFQRDWEERPSAVDLLSYPFIGGAPGEDFLRQASFESVGDAEGSNGNEIFGASGSWGERNKQQRQAADVEGIGQRVESNYNDDDANDSATRPNGGQMGRDDSVDQGDWLGSGLLESKMSMGGGGSDASPGTGTNMSGSFESLHRNNSMHRALSMNRDVEDFIRERAEDFEQSFVSTFRKKDERAMGTPPVSRQPPRRKGSDEEEEDNTEDGVNPFAFVFNESLDATCMRVSELIYGD